MSRRYKFCVIIFFQRVCLAISYTFFFCFCSFGHRFRTKWITTKTKTKSRITESTEAEREDEKRKENNKLLSAIFLLPYFFCSFRSFSSCRYLIFSRISMRFFFFLFPLLGVLFDIYSAHFMSRAYTTFRNSDKTQKTDIIFASTWAHYRNFCWQFKLRYMTITSLFGSCPKKFLAIHFVADLLISVHFFFTLLHSFLVFRLCKSREHKKLTAKSSFAFSEVKNKKEFYSLLPSEIAKYWNYLLSTSDRTWRKRKEKEFCWANSKISLIRIK